MAEPASDAQVERIKAIHTDIKQSAGEEQARAVYAQLKERWPAFRDVKWHASLFLEDAAAAIAFLEEAQAGGKRPEPESAAQEQASLPV